MCPCGIEEAVMRCVVQVVRWEHTSSVLPEQLVDARCAPIDVNHYADSGKDAQTPAGEQIPERRQNRLLRRWKMTAINIAKLASANTFDEIGPCLAKLEWVSHLRAQNLVSSTTHLLNMLFLQEPSNFCFSNLLMCIFIHVSSPKRAKNRNCQICSIQAFSRHFWSKLTDSSLVPSPSWMRMDKTSTKASVPPVNCRRFVDDVLRRRSASFAFFDFYRHHTAMTTRHQNGC